MEVPSRSASRSVTSIAIVGIVLSGVAAGIYFPLLSKPVRSAITGTLGLPYLVLALVGGGVQAVAWLS